jgi:hypothetical protein
MYSNNIIMTLTLDKFKRLCYTVDNSIKIKKNEVKIMKRKFLALFAVVAITLSAVPMTDVSATSTDSRIVHVGFGQGWRPDVRNGAGPCLVFDCTDNNCVFASLFMVDITHESFTIPPLDGTCAEGNVGEFFITFEDYEEYVLPFEGVITPEMFARRTDMGNWWGAGKEAFVIWFTPIWDMPTSNGCTDSNPCQNCTDCGFNGGRFGFGRVTAGGC